ncbi:AI-2E family transporter [Hymenobacter sp. BT770]|uniref:AI-2E family transporter n=1 Tax=Hymenobacter sp. BT770 TaxID=2886942 RepID=UPI001D1030EA|nr:AI-2E family transporter [Hymenobacter sp. BT770]MCC3153023.1 AI-2E family transporter [Hymenobacter sp. BT770]MDO3415064.1 AI-2E family transporter [Hymenobacter sp. BT770]
MFPPLINRVINRGSPHSNVAQQSGAIPEAKLAPVVHYTFLLIGLSLLVFVLHKLDGILLPLFFSALLSTLLLPLVTKLEGWGWSRVLAIIAAILLLVSGLAGLIILFGSQILDLRAELPLIQQKLAIFFDQGQQWLHDRLGMRVMSKDEFIDSSLSSAKKSAGGFLGSTISTTAGVLSVVTLIPIYIFCFLYYRDHMRQFMFRFVAPDKRTTVLHTMDSIQTVVQAYISGLLTVIVIVSVLNAIGLLILGVKFAVFFAIFASILAVIPYIGIMIGATIPALITLVETGSPAKAAGVVGVFVFVQFLEGNFITPMITGSKVSINPMAAIVALILGGELWGTPGMILSIPLVAVLKVVFDSNKTTEPWGFLLGDVTDGDDTKRDKSDDKPGFLGKAWHMIKRM